VVEQGTLKITSFEAWPLDFALHASNRIVEVKPVGGFAFHKLAPNEILHSRLLQ
jgi:hypothetical protein